MTDLLARKCPNCGSLYGEHDLTRLAQCVEDLLVWDDEQALEAELDDWSDNHLIALVGLARWGDGRRTETVDGPTIRTLLGDPRSYGVLPA